MTLLFFYVYCIYSKAQEKTKTRGRTRNKKRIKHGTRKGQDKKQKIAIQHTGSEQGKKQKTRYSKKYKT